MEFKILKKGNKLVAYDLVDKKRSYGSISLSTGKFIGDTRCLIALNEQRDKILNETGVITILDLMKGEVCIYQYPKNVEDIEEWIIDNTTHCVNDINYMCTDTLILKNNIK